MGFFPHAEGLGKFLRDLHRTATASLEIGISAPATITLELRTTNMKENGLDRAALTVLLSWCENHRLIMSGLLQLLVFLDNFSPSDFN